MGRAVKWCYVLIVLVVTAITACKKAPNGANIAFIGRDDGNDMAQFQNNIYPQNNMTRVRVLASGINPNIITIIDSVYGNTFTGTVSDSSFVISGSNGLPFTSCDGGPYAGSGSIGNKVVISYKAWMTFDCNGTPGTDTFTFSGVRE